MYDMRAEQRLARPNLAGSDQRHMQTGRAVSPAASVMQFVHSCNIQDSCLVFLLLVRLACVSPAP